MSAAKRFSGDGPLIPAGWTVEGWLQRLEYLTGICMDLKRRETLRQWAE